MAHAIEVSSAKSSERLAKMAQTCEGFYIVISFLAYLGAALLIFFGIRNGGHGVAAGIGLAAGITVSLLPVLLLCRWAQAYAADLAMRSPAEAGLPETRIEPIPDYVPSEPTGLYGHKR